MSDEPEQPGGKRRAFKGLPGTRPSSYGSFFLQLPGTCWRLRDLVHPSRQGNSIAIAARKKFPAAVRAAREQERPLHIPKVLETYEGKENQKKYGVQQWPMKLGAILRLGFGAHNRV